MQTVLKQIHLVLICSSSKNTAYGDKTVEINRGAAELAREVCNEFEDRYRYVIGSVGPTGFLPSSEDQDLGKVSPQEIIEGFIPQFEGLLLGGVDSLLIETSQDILEVKLAIEAFTYSNAERRKKSPSHWKRYSRQVRKYAFRNGRASSIYYSL